jgi:DNA transformation protein and related proteins
MSTPVSSIRNLGPATEAAFARAGITSAETLHALGADEGYRRLLLAGERPHFIAYYVIVMGLQGRPWNDCRGAEKAALRVRFDALVAETRGSPADSAIERELDAIGLPRPRPAPPVRAAGS